MTRVVAPSLIVGAAMCAGSWGLYIACPGCIDRARVNKSCEWTGDRAFAIDPHNAAHQEHLVADAQLAEELAVRHADAEFGRRFGVEHHGGLLDNGQFRRECFGRMIHAIEVNHRITAEQVHGARGHRHWMFELWSALLFVPIYSLASVIACRWLLARFASDGPPAAGRRRPARLAVVTAKCHLTDQRTRLRISPASIFTATSTS